MAGCGAVYEGLSRKIENRDKIETKIRDDREIAPPRIRGPGPCPDLSRPSLGAAGRCASETTDADLGLPAVTDPPSAQQCLLARGRDADRHVLYCIASHGDHARLDRVPRHWEQHGHDDGGDGRPGHRRSRACVSRSTDLAHPRRVLSWGGLEEFASTSEKHGEHLSFKLECRRRGPPA